MRFNTLLLSIEVTTEIQRALLIVLIYKASYKRLFVASIDYFINNFSINVIFIVLFYQKYIKYT